MAEPRCHVIQPLLSSWLDGELPAEEHATVARHVAACEACAGEQQRVAAVRSLVRSLPERACPRGIPAAAARRAWTTRRRLAAAGTAIAVLTGLLGGAAFALGGQPPPDSRTVHVPMDAFVAEHIVHSVNGPPASGVAGDPAP